jgi:hypothetical protein
MLIIKLTSTLTKYNFFNIIMKTMVIIAGIDILDNNLILKIKCFKLYYSLIYHLSKQKHLS